jgi:hypothetical protein
MENTNETKIETKDTGSNSGDDSEHHRTGNFEDWRNKTCCLRGCWCDCTLCGKKCPKFDPKDPTLLRWNHLWCSHKAGAWKIFLLLLLFDSCNCILIFYYDPQYNKTHPKGHDVQYWYMIAGTIFYVICFFIIWIFYLEDADLRHVWSKGPIIVFALIVFQIVLLTLDMVSIFETCGKSALPYNQSTAEYESVLNSCLGKNMRLVADLVQYPTLIVTIIALKFERAWDQYQGKLAMKSLLFCAIFFATIYLVGTVSANGLHDAIETIQENPVTYLRTLWVGLYIVECWRFLLERSEWRNGKIGSKGKVTGRLRDIETMTGRNNSQVYTQLAGELTINNTGVVTGDVTRIRNDEFDYRWIVNLGNETKEKITKVLEQETQQKESIQLILPQYDIDEIKLKQCHAWYGNEPDPHSNIYIEGKFDFTDSKKQIFYSNGVWYLFILVLLEEIVCSFGRFLIVTKRLNISDVNPNSTVKNEMNEYTYIINWSLGGQAIFHGISFILCFTIRENYIHYQQLWENRRIKFKREINIFIGFCVGLLAIDIINLINDAHITLSWETISSAVFDLTFNPFFLFLLLLTPPMDKDENKQQPKLLLIVAALLVLVIEVRVSKRFMFFSTSSPLNSSHGGEQLKRGLQFAKYFTQIIFQIEVFQFTLAVVIHGDPNPDATIKALDDFKEKVQRSPEARKWKKVIKDSSTTEPLMND